MAPEQHGALCQFNAVASVADHATDLQLTARMLQNIDAIVAPGADVAAAQAYFRGAGAGHVGQGISGDHAVLGHGLAAVIDVESAIAALDDLASLEVWMSARGDRDPGPLVASHRAAR